MADTEKPTLILTMTNVGKQGNLFPADTTKDAFDRILRETRRALTWGVDNAPDRVDAYEKVCSHLAAVIATCEKERSQHVPDFTGMSARVKPSTCQMFWMHKIRRHCGATKVEFDHNFPYASLAWVQIQHQQLRERKPRALAFLQAWRELL